MAGMIAPYRVSIFTAAVGIAAARGATSHADATGSPTSADSMDADRGLPALERPHA
jgi:hypothetical protein